MQRNSPGGSTWWASNVTSVRATPCYYYYVIHTYQCTLEYQSVAASYLSYLLASHLLWDDAVQPEAWTEWTRRVTTTADSNSVLQTEGLTATVISCGRGLPTEQHVFTARCWLLLTTLLIVLTALFTCSHGKLQFLWSNSNYLHSIFDHIIWSLIHKHNNWPNVPSE